MGSKGTVKEAIKKTYKGKPTSRQLTMKEVMIEQKFNALFKAKKKPKQEIKFLNHILTRDGEQQERFGLHASAIIESENKFCLREQVLSLFFKQIQGDNIPPGLKRIFEEGNVIHEKWQRLFIRGGLGKWSDMDRSRFDLRYDLSFTPDAEINIFEFENIPVEIKSMNTFAYKKTTTHSKAKKQLMFYMYLLKKKHGIILCDDKNCQEFFPQLIKFDKEAMRPYVMRLNEIQRRKQRFLEHGKLPKRMCRDCGTKRAQECGMKDACFNIGMGRIWLPDGQVAK